MTPFFIVIGLNIIFISCILAVIEFIKKYNIHLIGVFGFVSACTSVLIQLLQYKYIKHRAGSEIAPFLKHSIIGYGLVFLFSILLYYLVQHTNISHNHIIYGFVISLFIIWILYIAFFRHLF